MSKLKISAGEADLQGAGRAAGARGRRVRQHLPDDEALPRYLGQVLHLAPHRTHDLLLLRPQTFLGKYPSDLTTTNAVTQPRLNQRRRDGETRELRLDRKHYNWSPAPQIVRLLRL